MRRKSSALILVLIFGSAGFLGLFYESPPSYEGGALIIDTLSSWKYGYPMPSEIEDVVSRSGLQVHYYEKVDTNFLRYLPMKGYKLIILRVHSNFDAFTVNEAYSGGRYLLDQFLGRVKVFVSEEDTDRSFAITPKFISESMKGRFDGTIVVLMGCRGLQQNLAWPFLDKGAKAFIGWTNMVTLPYTDMATALFLEKFLIENKPLKASLDETIGEIPPDREYNARLGFYPRTQGELTAELLVP